MVVSELRCRLTNRFDDEIRFIRGLVDRPRNVGAIAPTSAVMARRMASVIDPTSGLPVLELGPGTGSITRAILQRGMAPERIVAVEFSADFATLLRTRFPGLNVIRGDAFDLATTLAETAPCTQMFDCAISGVPLLNFPMADRIRFVERVLDRLPVGRPLIQFTYGPFPPAPRGRGNYDVRHFDFVMRNLPPARLWTYSRKAN